MSSLELTAPPFVEMAHRIVWATVATVDGRGRPRGRILHPYWVWDGTSLVGWIATGPTPVKRAALEASFTSPSGPGTATLALNLDGLVFETGGEHTFVLAIDGAERTRLRFRVQTSPEPAVTEHRTGVYL